MEVKQIYTLVNTALKETTGVTDILQEDLTGLVDVGEAVFNASAVDKYIGSLLNQVGRMVIVDRLYTGHLLSVLRDSWEFGSVVEKIRTPLVEASENESWELVGGTSYDPNVFYASKASVKFFNKKTTFEIDKSFTDLQLKQSFQSAAQMNAFLTSMKTQVENSMTIAMENLIKRTINNFTAEVLFKEVPAGNYNAVSTTKAVNLLKLYNDNHGTNLTKEKAIFNPEFIRYSSYIIKDYQDLLTTPSVLFNEGGTEKFTSKDKQHLVLLSQFHNAAKVYLYDANGQVNTDNIKLPDAEILPNWQGNGSDLSFAKRSTINVKTSSGNVVNVSGVIGVLFDHDALGVTNYDRRVTTNYNPKAEFTNYFYKQDAGYFNDLDENFVVFYIA